MANPAIAVTKLRPAQRDATGTCSSPRPHQPARHRRPTMNSRAGEQTPDRITRLPKEKNPMKGGSAPLIPPGVRPYPGHRVIPERQSCKWRAKICDARRRCPFFSLSGARKTRSFTGLSADSPDHACDQDFLNHGQEKRNFTRNARFSRTSLHRKSAATPGRRTGRYKLFLLRRVFYEPRARQS